MTLSAEEARSITDNAEIDKPDIAIWKDWIDSRIRKAASNGHSRIDEAFSGVRMAITPRERKAVKNYYISAGFTWHDNNSISWK